MNPKLRPMVTMRKRTRRMIFHLELKKDFLVLLPTILLRVSSFLNMALVRIYILPFIVCHLQEYFLQSFVFTDQSPEFGHGAAEHELAFVDDADAVTYLFRHFQHVGGDRKSVV